MSQAAERQRTYSARLFLVDIGLMLAQALTMAPHEFSAPETDFINKLVLGLEEAEQATENYWNEGNFLNLDAMFKYVNDLYATLTKDLPKDKGLQIISKALEVLTVDREGKLAVLRKLPTELYALVMANLSLRDTVTTNDKVAFWYKLWKYISDGIVCSSDPTAIRSQVEGLGVLPPLAWIPNGTFCYIVASVINRKYSFDGRVKHKSKYYNIDRVKVLQKYSGPNVVVSDTERAGVEEIFFTFRDPEHSMSDYAFRAIQTATAGTEAMTEVTKLTTHCVGMFGARIRNLLPSRAWCDVCNENDGDIMQCREGYDSKEINASTYSIRMGDDRYYPADSISLGKDDTAIITNITQLMLTGIVKDGKRMPDILYNRNQVC